LAGAITQVEFTDRFKRELAKLPDDIKAAATVAIRDIYKNPVPAMRRFHRLGGYKNPKVFTIDVTANKAYKISLEIDGTKASLRRIGTHKELDRKA
jgi:hypothetical protein